MAKCFDIPRPKCFNTSKVYTSDVHWKHFPLNLTTVYCFPLLCYFLQTSKPERLWKVLLKMIICSNYFILDSMFLFRNFFLYHGNISILWNFFLTHSFWNIISNSCWSWTYFIIVPCAVFCLSYPFGQSTIHKLIEYLIWLKQYQ